MFGEQSLPPDHSVVTRVEKQSQTTNWITTMVGRVQIATKITTCLSIEPAVYQSHAFKIENIKEALPGKSIMHPLEQNILGQKPHLGS